jgi:arylsulfatase I/J
MIVADDLGYNDLGVTNGGKTITPELDSLIKGGVTLSSYYTFRVCSPTRASIQTGRYPWGIGFYDMSDDSSHCVDSAFKMLPQLMKDEGYRTHAIGKWDVGMIQRHCLPTYRGYETFLGYYTACTADYWMHGAPGDVGAHGKCNDIDFHNSTGKHIAGADMSGPNSVNGTYDQVVFTQRAVKHIHDVAGTGDPLFLFLAYHNVHDACTADRYTAGLNAPLETVLMYPTTKLDTFKLQGAMTTGIHSPYTHSPYTHTHRTLTLHTLTVPSSMGPQNLTTG